MKMMNRSVSKLEDGFNVFWTVNELSYPVTVLRLLGNSKPV